MKIRMRWERLVPHTINTVKRNLAAFSLGGILLGGLLIGSAEIFDASGSQTQRQTGHQEQEEATDQVLLRQSKDDPNTVLVTGIKPVTDHKKAHAQAESNHVTADSLRILGKSSLASAAGLGLIGAVRRRRENHAAATTSRAALQRGLAAAERRRNERNVQPDIPHSEPTPEITLDTVRQEVHQLGQSIGSMLADIEAMTTRMKLDAETARQQHTRDNELDARIATIREEHAGIKAEMELGRQATLLGFANLRDELGLPPALDNPYSMPVVPLGPIPVGV